MEFNCSHNETIISCLNTSLFCKPKISRSLWRKKSWSFYDNCSYNDSDLAISNANCNFLHLMVKTYA